MVSSHVVQCLKTYGTARGYAPLPTTPMRIEKYGAHGENVLLAHFVEKLSVEDEAYLQLQPAITAGILTVDWTSISRPSSFVQLNGPADFGQSDELVAAVDDAFRLACKFESSLSLDGAESKPFEEATQTMIAAIDALGYTSQTHLYSIVADTMILPFDNIVDLFKYIFVCTVRRRGVGLHKLAEKGIEVTNMTHVLEPVEDSAAAGGSAGFAAEVSELRAKLVSMEDMLKAQTAMLEKQAVFMQRLMDAAVVGAGAGAGAGAGESPRTPPPMLLVPTLSTAPAASPPSPPLLLSNV